MSTPDENSGFRRPRFKDKMHAVVSAAYGVPFWRSAGLWTTEDYCDYVEGKLTFDKIIGCSIIKGLEERKKLMNTVSVLQSMDVEW